MIIEDLIDTSHFVAEDQKDLCKKYFCQIPISLESTWFYSLHTSSISYQGDIIDKFYVSFTDLEGDNIITQAIEDQACMLMSNTCDMYFEDKTREKYISVAPIFNYDEFANSPKPAAYSEQGWIDFLKDVRENKITDILYIPGKNGINDSVVLLDMITSFDPKLLSAMIEKESTKRILTLSQIGYYFFLIKLTYHFARYEDKDEVKRD